MDKETEKDDYIPFGPEWEKYMMRLPKKYLIDIIRKNKQESKRPNQMWDKSDDRAADYLSEQPIEAKEDMPDGNKEAIDEAIKLIERAYALNKDDFGFDLDVIEFIDKYKK